jgi:purine catabolism regulator
MDFFAILDAVPEIGLQLLTPGVDLHKPVEGIDVTETPDIHQYIAKKTLLLTTGMVYRDDPGGLARLIENLHQAGVSGLAVKLGRFLSRIEPEALARAEELGFPVFQIPAETTLGIVAHKLQAQLLGVETRQLHYALDIQKKISSLLFRDSSLEELLHYFSRLLQRRTLYFDFFFSLLSQGCPRETTSPLGRERIAKIASPLRAIHLQRPINAIDEFLLPDEDGEIHCLVVPVKAGREYPHFLVVLYDGNMPEFFSYFVAESASSVFAFAAHNRRQLLAKDWEFRQEAFRRLLERKDPVTAVDLRALSATYTYAGPGPWQLVAMGFSAGSLPDEFAGLDSFALVYAWVKKKIAHLEKTAIVVPLPSEHHFVLLLREPAVLLRSFLRSMGEDLGKHLALTLKFGVANQLPDLSALCFGYVQASQTLREALENKRDKQHIHFYHSRGVQELFRFVPPEHIRHFCLHTLKELAYPESEPAQGLRRTIETYLNCQSDISRTAKILGIHRNTVKYRMEKARCLLGLPPDGNDQSLELRLAILLSKIDLERTRSP